MSEITLIPIHKLENNTGQIKDVPQNPRDLSPENLAKCKKSIQEFPDMLNVRCLIVVPFNDIYVCMGGNARLKAMRELGYKECPCIIKDGWTSAEIRRFLIVDNENYGEWNWEQLAMDFDLSELDDFGLDFPDEFLEGDDVEVDADDPYDTENKNNGSLAEKFGIPPFSVFNAREGWWQDRKSAWLAMGIESELGRGDNLLKFSEVAQLPKRKNKYATSYTTDGIDEKYGREPQSTGTSIFDPVLCEIAYRWFSWKGATIIDPFAGGSVRGILASALGRSYIGVDLRQEQVDANLAQLSKIDLGKNPLPTWISGDSKDIDKHISVNADMLFTCPPYADLEVYSDDPRDISNMNYDSFKQIYFEIIKKSCKLLKDNSFAVIVVGECRDKKGNYYNFVGDTIQAFLEAGLSYYNEAILVTAVGTLPIRCKKPFLATRKLGKTHQNILVFCKGDAKIATEKCGECDFKEEEQIDADQDL